MIKDPIVVMDNVEAMKILADVGLVDKLAPEGTYTTAAVYFEYKDCWCMGAYHKGHPDPKDNGFMVVMLPKTMVSKDAAKALFDDVREMSKAAPGGTVRLVTVGKDRQ